MDRKEHLAEMKEFIKRVQKDFLISKFILFGSRATGNVKKDSDFDLIIVSDDFEGINVFDRVAKMYDYWTLLTPVDFICLTTKEFNSLKRKISIVSTALEEGLVLTG